MQKGMEREDQGINSVLMNEIFIIEGKIEIPSFLAKQ